MYLERLPGIGGLDVPCGAGQGRPLWGPCDGKETGLDKPCSAGAEGPRFGGKMAEIERPAERNAAPGLGSGQGLTGTTQAGQDCLYSAPQATPMCVPPSSCNLQAALSMLTLTWVGRRERQRQKSRRAQAPGNAQEEFLEEVVTPVHSGAERSRGNDKGGTAGVQGRGVSQAEAQRS